MGKNKYIKCDCHTHLLEVSKWDDEDNQTILTFWDYFEGLWTNKNN